MITIALSICIILLPLALYQSMGRIYGNKGQHHPGVVNGNGSAADKCGTFLKE